MSANPQMAPQYSKTAKWLHWFMAVVIIFDLIMAQGFSTMPDEQKGEILIGHSSIGSILLLLVLFRIFWRYKHPVSALPETVAQWQTTASRVSHLLLYALMIIVPLTGYYIATASPIAVMPFASFVLGGEGMTEEGFMAVRSLHAIATKLLMVLVSIHLIAAFNHWLLQKDGVFQRMAPRFGRGK